MKRVLVTGAVCLILGAAVDRLFLHGAVSQPATATSAASKPTYTMPNNEPGNQGNGPASKERLAASPRHQEMIDIKVPGQDKPMKAFIVHPERADKAPVVIVIMEIFGMTDWVKSTTDQLAADGFIAIAPDFPSLKATVATGNPTQGITAADVTKDCDAVRDYALKLPNANGKLATIGFCWGGGMSFSYAVAQPELNAAVVFYGTPPADGDLAKIKAPVSGFYAKNDARITATVAATIDKMKAAGKSYESHIFDGAGHGFMRAPNAAANPGNEKGATEAWPMVLKFLRDNTKVDAPK